MSRYGLLALPVLAAGLAFTAPALRDSAPEAGDEIEWRGPPGSVTPNLAVGAGGRLILTWLEPVTPAGTYAFRFAVRERGRWSPPGTIRQGTGFFVNWADFGSLAETGDGRWVAHWLEKTAAAPYAYHVMLSLSRDRGKTWSDPIRAHDDSSATEHGFVAMSPGPAGLDLVWLDGRGMNGDDRGAMAVRTRTLGSGNRLLPEIELDARSCECCQTALARTPDGLVAAFRDRSDGEVRDIAVARQVGGQWRTPRVVASDEWEHRACPVNGPALAADGRQVDLVWYTGVRSEPRVWLVRSGDAGVSFGRRIRIDEGQTLGRLDAEPLGDGSLLVAWLETSTDQEADWRIRLVNREGRAGPSRVVATVTRARLAGFPRLARVADHVFLAHTATGPAGGVRVTRLVGIPEPR